MATQQKSTAGAALGLAVIVVATAYNTFYRCVGTCWSDLWMRGKHLLLTATEVGWGPACAVPNAELAPSPSLRAQQHSM
jgi:hypothetical protein